MVTITRHVFINIFQTEHSLTVKFAMRYEKNMSFLVIVKSPKVSKKVEKIGLGSFKFGKVHFIHTTPSTAASVSYKRTMLSGQGCQSKEAASLAVKRN